MKKINSLLVYMLTMAIAVLAGTTAQATTKAELKVGDNNEIVLHGSTAVTVPVYLLNDGPVSSMQFDIKYTGIDVEFEFNTARVPSDKFIASCNYASNIGGYRVLVVPSPTGSTMPSIAAGNEPIGYLTVSTEANNFEATLKVSNIKIAGEKGEDGEYQHFDNVKGFDVNVKILTSIVLSTTADEVVLHPGSSADVTLCIANEATLQGFEFMLTLPEGLSYKDNSVVMTDRKVAGSTVTVSLYEGNTYNVLAYNFLDNEVVKSGEGAVMTFTVVAGEKLAQKDVMPIEIKKFLGVVNENGNEAENEVSVAVKNCIVEYNAGLEAISASQTALNEAVANSGIEAAALQQLIDDQKDALETAYEVNDVEALNAVVNACADINAQIEAAVSAKADAEAEAARVAANQAAYEADLAAINDDIVPALEALLAQYKEQYGEYVNETDAAAVIAEANALKEAAAAALAAVKDEGVYKSVIGETTKADLIAKMEAVGTAAAAAKAEAERVAANQAAYEADLAAINDIVAALEAKVTEMKEAYGEYLNEADANAVVNEAKALKEAAAAALAAVAEEGTYKSVVAENAKADFLAKLQLVADAAAAAKAAAEDENARVAANQAAYEADLAAINDIVAALEAKVTEMKEAYGEYLNEADANAVVNEAKALKEAAAAALAAVAEEGTYKSVVAENAKADFLAKLQLVADAAAEAKAAAEAENARVAANKAAYEAQLATLKQLQKDLNAMAAKVRDDFPAYKSESEINDVQEMINDAKDAADAAYAAVATEGTYTNDLDAEAITAAIQALYTDAAERQRVALNQAAYQADLTVVEGLEDKFDAAVAEITAKYSEGRNINAEEAVKAEIDALKQAVENAYANVQDAGDYASPLTDEKVADIIAKIDQLVRDAEAAGIFGIEIDLDQDYEIYTTAGFRVGKPVQGQMNIIRSNGKTYKVFVK